jgi:hypothetical protein
LILTHTAGFTSPGERLIQRSHVLGSDSIYILLN